MKKTLVIATLLLAILSIAPSYAAVTVTLWKPTDQGYASTNVQIRAYASPTPGYTISGWIAYFNGVEEVSGGASQWFGATATVPAGTYQVVVRAWDTSGAYGSQTANITVVSGSTYFDIQAMNSGWGYCNDPSCSGGSGSGQCSYTQGIGNPSLASDSIEFFANGPNSDALFWNKLGANDGVHNFVWDWWFYVDSSIANEQCVESDIFQFVNGYDYMMGFQADFNSSTWDVWNEATGQWVHTGIGVSKFTSGTWHHMTLYGQTNTSSGSYDYVMFILDGQKHSLSGYAYSPKLHSGWADEVGVQYQLDPNSGGGNCYEWSDLSDLTVW